MDGLCVRSEHVTMAVLRSRLSLLTGMGGPPSVTTCAGFSATSREPSASALGDLKVTVRAFPPGQSPWTFHSSRSSCSERLLVDSAVPSHGVPSVSFGMPIEDQMLIAASAVLKQHMISAAVVLPLILLHMGPLQHRLHSPAPRWHDAAA